MSALAELVTVIEGPGSRPLLAAGVSARGMLNTATSPTAVARGRSIESADTTLYIARHRLPALRPGDAITVGDVDAADVASGDLTYLVQDRVPQDDGLLHAIRLDQGAAL